MNLDEICCAKIWLRCRWNLYLSNQQKNALELRRQKQLAKDVRCRDVVELLLGKVAPKAPCESSRLRAHLSIRFKWLLEREVIESATPSGHRRHK